MKILVTGGSGYLGTRVRTVLNASDYSRRAGLDIFDENDLEMVRDYDCIIHLAALLDKSRESADEVFRTNVQGTINVLKKVRRGAAFIFASTKDVYGPFADNFSEVPESCPTLYSGQSALEWSKLIAERYVEYYGHIHEFRTCIFRLSTVYGPLSVGNVPNFVGHYVEAINRGEPIALPGGGVPRRDLLHVDDLAHACRDFADSIIKRGLYNLGGGSGNAVSLLDLIRLMEEVSGLQAVLDGQTEIEAPRPLNYISDLKLVGQELGWAPKIDLRAGLETLF